MLRVQDVCSAYDGREILHKVNFSIKSGEITVFAGPNGCGKSTLLKTMIGILPKTDGNIWVDGRVMESYKSEELAKKIAYLPQNRNVPDITVKRMVLHGRFPYLTYPRRYRKIDMEIAEKAIRQVGMESYMYKSISQLSGGMQQKVYIAMALAQDTPVIMMDEPTSFLDIVYQMKLMDISRELAAQGKTIVLVLHDIAMAMRIADRIIVLKDGCIKGNGKPETVFESGVLDKVFGLKLKRVETEEGWQYYF